jgi:hypothetical protein
MKKKTMMMSLLIAGAPLLIMLLAWKIGLR